MLIPDALDDRAQDRVLLRPSRTALWIAFLRFTLEIGRRGDRQLAADRLDPDCVR
jgi:hypothetical protein